MTEENPVFRLSESGFFSELDKHFSVFISDLEIDAPPWLALTAALVSKVTREGDVCLQMDRFADRELSFEDTQETGVFLPPLDDWRNGLLRLAVIGRPGDYRPLILDACDRLYLYRYWEYESQLAKAILRRSQATEDSVDPEAFKKRITHLLPDLLGSASDKQKLAALTAILKRFTVISGGPGTGKTFTVTLILALLLYLEPEWQHRILLAAPTGKAASKLSESIQKVRNRLNLSERVRAAIPSETFTIHRLLRPVPGLLHFRHHANNPLSVDVLVVDEVSMVDLALLAKLMNAVPEKAKIILMGDKDQLASVESGAVLGDICNRGDKLPGLSSQHADLLKAFLDKPVSTCPDTEQSTSGLQDSIVLLDRSFRFAEDSAIARVSRAINQGSVRIIEKLKPAQTDTQGVEWREIENTASMEFHLAEVIDIEFENLKAVADPKKALEFLNRFKILCAVNKGPFGVEAVNGLVEKLLFKKGVVERSKIDPYGNYPGKPLLIKQNNYATGLFNGDMGIVWPFGSELYAIFNENGRIRRIPLNRIPEYDTAYAMTVHKSQGSEFENVLLILPNIQVPVLTRELLYTAISRSQKRAMIWGREQELAWGINRRIERRSGLRDMLWRNGSNG